MHDRSSFDGNPLHALKYEVFDHIIEFIFMSPTAEDDAAEEETPKANVSDTAIRSAIPYMPLSLAVMCFILNVFVPGTGKNPSYK